jgi:hypothetical protein
VGIALLALSIQLSNDKDKEAKSGVSKMYGDLLNYDQYLWQKRYSYMRIARRFKAAIDICEKEDVDDDTLSTIVKHIYIMSGALRYDSNRIINENKDIIVMFDQSVRSVFSASLNAVTDNYVISDGYLNYMLRDFVPNAKSEERAKSVKDLKNYCSHIKQYGYFINVQSYFDSIAGRIVCSMAYVLEEGSFDKSRASRISKDIRRGLKEGEVASLDDVVESLSSIKNKDGCGVAENKISVGSVEDLNEKEK